MSSLVRAASIGGVVLATLATPANAQEARAQDDGAQTDETRTIRGRGGILRTVRVATSAEVAAARTAGSAYSQVSPSPFTPSDIGAYTSPTFGDLDGDGDLDAAVGIGYGDPRSGEIAYFTNDGTGVFTEQTGANNPFAAIDVTGGGGSGDANPSLGDVDGDGDLDLVVGSSEGRARLYINTGGVFTEQVGGADPFGGADFGRYTSAALGDIDGDGDLDLALAQSENNGSIRYFAGDGAGGFTLSGGQVSGISPGPYTLVELADIDGDGDVDLIAGSNTITGFNVYLNNGNGTFAAGAPGELAGVANGFAAEDPGMGDVDGDGDLDIAAGEVDGSLLLFDHIGTNPTVQITGTEGWRLIGSPDPDATLLNLLDDPLWLQGSADGDASNGAPNVFTWDEITQTYTPSTLTAQAGLRSVFVYVFECNDYSTVAAPTGCTFPKTIGVPGPVDLPVEIDYGTLSYTDDGDAGTTADGFNALSVEGSSWFDWEGVDLQNVSATVYVYDDGISNYRSYTQGVGEGTPALPGGIVAPFQGFWAQAQSATNNLTAHTETSDGGPTYQRTATPAVISLGVRPDAGSALPAGAEGGTTVAFRSAGASEGYGPEDAIALDSPAATSVSLRTRADGDDGNTFQLAVDQRPWVETVSEIPVDVVVDGVSGDQPLMLTPELRDVPDDWTLTLVDRVTGAEMDLRTIDSYAFSAAGSDDANRAAFPALRSPAVPAIDAAARTEASRFVVRVEAQTTDVGGTPTTASVSDARPNPAADRTAFRVELDAPEQVTVSVYDALGRRVTRAFDGPMSGTSVLSIDTSALATGVYVVRLEGDTFAEARQITVVR